MLLYIPPSGLLRSHINFARSRIFDKEDDNYLIPVDYEQAYRDNSSVLHEGGMHCPPNWVFHEFNCFYYFGAPLTFQEARDFCHTEIGASLASKHASFWTFAAQSCDLQSGQYSRKKYSTV
ncbi:unnamed protein product [Protopolystoma xenopodis]|uniref:C-type lectin domain-containing protein n=1 Tax=Protopolystoma xenopodis TaxID=117903 RepID=A0A448XPQ3_9PLAT|nr:unnamed protein product [Protopolystoma xenopodis]